MCKLPNFHLTTRYILVVLSFLFFVFFVVNSNVSAFSSNLSLSITLKDPSSVSPGNIISLVDGEYVLSAKAYDDNIFGVITESPALSLEEIGGEGASFVATTGEVFVKVSSVNGDITEGDYITSSDTAGVAQKATETGNVLGVALESYSATDTSEIGEILIFTNISTVFLNENLTSNLAELLSSGFKVPFLTPLTSLRYLLAAALTLTAFFFGFVNFGKVSANSVEALGRNPLARKDIRSTIILNFTLTVAIIVTGIFLAYLILVL